MRRVVEAWTARRARLLAPLALCLAALCLTLAACAAPSGAQTATAPAGAANVSPTSSSPVPTTTPGGAATPTITPLPGSANLAGATDICTSPISVSAQLPAEIPAFDGQLRLAQSSGGNSEFGYCSNASVQAIADFFSAQLPGKGWQNIQTFTNNSSRNLIATRGAENLTITISPDVVQTGNADLLIILTGQGG